MLKIIGSQMDTEFVEVVRLLGEHMGERTSKCVDYLARQFPGLPKELRFPPEFLLGIALAGQLRRWENLAPAVMEAERLPAAEFVLRATIRIWSGPELSAYVAALAGRVTAVFRDRFLWCAERNNEVIAIQSDANDLDMEALAEFLIARGLDV